MKNSWTEKVAENRHVIVKGKLDVWTLEALVEDAEDLAEKLGALLDAMRDGLDSPRLVKLEARLESRD